MGDPYILHNIKLKVPNPMKDLPEQDTKLKIKYRQYTI
jgi:hypothetical protein